MALTIVRLINNNIVLIKDSCGKEVVAMGKGIGFGKKPGAAIEENRIEKRFLLDSEEQADQFTELVKKIPKEYLSITVEIVEHAIEVFKGRVKLSSSVYISLADHIDFACERIRKGMVFENPLLNEVRVFYPTEYLIGEFGVDLIERRTGICFPIDEAASLALHIVNAEYDVDISTTMKITSLVGESTRMLRDELGIRMDEKGLDYSRFITHMKFMCQRIFTGKMLGEKDDLSDLIIGKYKMEYEICSRISDYITEKYEITLTQAEIAFLTIHVRRLEECEEEA